MQPEAGTEQEVGMAHLLVVSFPDHFSCAKNGLGMRLCLGVLLGWFFFVVVWLVFFLSLLLLMAMLLL